MSNEHQDRLDRLAARRAAASRGTTPDEGLTIHEFDPAAFATRPAVAAPMLSGFAPPDPASLIEPNLAIGHDDPLGDLRRANKVNKTRRTTSGKRRHVAGAGRILSAGLSTSAFFAGIAALAATAPSASAYAKKNAAATPVTTVAPVIIERDVYVDESGNEVAAPAATTPAPADPGAVDPSSTVPTTVDPLAPTTVDPNALATLSAPDVPADDPSVLAGAADLTPGTQPGTPTAGPVAKATSAGAAPANTSPVAGQTAAPAAAPAPAPSSSLQPNAPAPEAAPAPAPAAAPPAPAPAPASAPAPAPTAAPAPAPAPAPGPAPAPAPACTGSKC